MKVKYKLTMKELLRFYPHYSKHVKQKNHYLRWLLIFLLWQCVISTFIWLVSFTDDNLPIKDFFLLGNIVLLILWPLVSKEWIRQTAVLRNLLLKRTVEINDKEVLSFVRQSSYNIAWSDILEVEKIRDFICLRSIDILLIIPSRAFDSNEDFNEFFEFAKNHQQDVELEKIDVSQFRPRRSKRNVILAWVFILLVISGFVIFNVLVSMDNFWTKPFSGEDLEVTYSLFTDSLKDRISQKEWENTISHWRQKIGPLEKVKVLSFVPYDFKLEDKKFPIDGRKDGDKIIGEKGEIKIISYFHLIDGEWLLNGFEFIPSDISMESYIDKKDVTNFEEDNF